MKHQIKITPHNFQLIATTLLAINLVFQGFVSQAFAGNPLLGQEAAIVARTNQVRAEVGLASLTVDARLTQSATAKANDMAARGYFDHGNPDGYRMAYWINGAGYTYSLAGENLAKGYSSLDRVINAWVASPSHYKNLVEPKFTNIGIGMAEGTYDNQPTLFIVQHFGAEATPTAKAVAPMVSVVAPLVESVAGATDEQTIINNGPDGRLAPIQPQVIRSATLTPAKLVETAQAGPLIFLEQPPAPTDPLRFWPIFALIALALIGYLDEYLPLWAATRLQK